MALEENELGEITVSEEFFIDVIKSVVAESLGVVGTIENVEQKIKSFIKQKINNSGILIEKHDQNLFIELHIKVKYGVNISEAVKNLVEKIRYTIENYDVGMCVKNIDVCVDKMVSD
ncbi:MAG: Asp23/Gls24 family envelope stress response protein [Oscillospiraceae bacterium]|jgi:uncharacterized alkaline shock family protein YloU|nr:Asp23/Gls24 family envelope stress response protein [Oscillospiraceae bacterium]